MTMKLRTIHCSASSANVVKSEMDIHAVPNSIKSTYNGAESMQYSRSVPERLEIFFGKRTSWKPARGMVCTSILWRLKMKNWKNLKKSSGKQGKTIAFPVVQNTKINLRNDRVCPKRYSRTSDKNMLFWNARI